MIDRLLSSQAFISAFTSEELSVIRTKLTTLLDGTAAAYAGGNTQPGEEVRFELFSSLLYSLSLETDHPQTFRPLLFEVPEARFENAQFILRRKADCATRLCDGILRLFPLPSRSVKKTLLSISDALRRYDPAFFAHRLNADYAYPLTAAPDSGKQGVDYALEYLIRLSSEASVIRAFAPHRAAALLDGWRADWKTADINLLAPLLGNALALTLLSRDPRRLHISQTDRKALFALLALKNKEQLTKTLLCVFPDTAKALGLDDPDDVALVMNAARALAPRIHDACCAGDLAGVFPAFALPGQR